MFGVGYQELVILLVIFLVFFGARRIPKLSRALGESIGELRNGLRAFKNTSRSDQM
jgi:TatA/E family protein of Tat protein translocase